jgi:TolA-binding protein
VKPPSNEELAFELSQLKLQVEQLQVGLESIETRVEKSRSEIQGVRLKTEKHTALLKKTEENLGELESEAKRRNIRTLNERSELLLKDERFDEVLGLIQPVIQEVDPKEEGHDGLLMHLAKAFWGRGSFEEAALTAADVEVYHPSSQWIPEALLLQAKCFRKLKKSDQSEVFLKDLINRFPSTPQAKEAKKLLKPPNSQASAKPASKRPKSNKL